MKYQIIMNTEYSFLNNHEPSESQLRNIMKEVALEAKVKADLAKKKLFGDLQELVKRLLSEQAKND